MLTKYLSPYGVAKPLYQYVAIDIMAHSTLTRYWDWALILFWAKTQEMKNDMKMKRVSLQRINDIQLDRVKHDSIFPGTVQYWRYLI